MHEIPMFHLETKPFALTVKDWSAEVCSLLPFFIQYILIERLKLHASTSIATTAKYWNLKNSHWEPIIDPWTFSATVRQSLSSLIIQFIIDGFYREQETLSHKE